MTPINVGDKVWYKTVLCGTIKAIVIKKEVSYSGYCSYTLRVTSRKNSAFYQGYEFESGRMFIWKR